MTNELKIYLTVEKISAYYSNNSFAQTMIYIDNYFDVNHSRPSYPIIPNSSIFINADDLCSDYYMEHIDNYIKLIDDFKTKLQRYREDVIEYRKVLDAKHKLIWDFMLFESQIDTIVPVYSKSKVISLANESGDDDYGKIFLMLLDLVELFRK